MTLHFSQHILHSDQFGYARHRLRYILIANPRATVARQHYENNDQSINRASTNFRGDGKRSTVEAKIRHDDMIREEKDENNNSKRNYDRSDSD